MNPCRRWLHKFSRIPDSKRNESERFFCFRARIFRRCPTRKAVLWYLGFFSLPLSGFPFLFPAISGFGRESRKIPGLNPGMTPGKMSGTSLNMTDKRKPEYDGKDGERDKSEKLIFFLKNQLICYRFADSSKNRPAPFGACGHVLTI